MLIREPLKFFSGYILHLLFFVDFYFTFVLVNECKFFILLNRIFYTVMFKNLKIMLGWYSLIKFCKVECKSHFLSLTHKNDWEKLTKNPKSSFKSHEEWDLMDSHPNTKNLGFWVGKTQRNLKYLCFQNFFLRFLMGKIHFKTLGDIFTFI